MRDGRGEGAINQDLRRPPSDWSFPESPPAVSWTAPERAERRNLVIDRKFRDSEGKPWIVDYKTSSHEGAGLDAFLDRERGRNAPQLERYARALGEGERVDLGLYFPLVSGWRDWK